MIFIFKAFEHKISLVVHSTSSVIKREKIALFRILHYLCSYII